MLDINPLVRYYNEAVTERYRSGHNEAVLKTVCPQGRVGSNPTLSAGFMLYVGGRAAYLQLLHILQ